MTNTNHYEEDGPESDPLEGLTDLPRWLRVLCWVVFLAMVLGSCAGLFALVMVHLR